MMKVQFQEIGPVLAARGLELPTLNALTADLQHYETMVIQPTGRIEATADFVRHADRCSAASRFRSFLSLAQERNADLVVTPEYSCPWEVLLDCLAHNRLPTQGHIWALACESIKPEELAAAIAARPDVIWIHEKIPAPRGGRFLDPLAYITRAVHQDGSVKVVVVLQFKTHPMGGNAFEQDHLICGMVIYLWHNPDNLIRLVSLICSEALAFDAAAAKACSCHLHPFIILHPQLNSNPRHAALLKYRSELFAQNDSTHLEVLTLNWSRGFAFVGEAASSYGGSAVYTKAPQFTVTDDRLESNHRRGMFYAWWLAQQTQLCLLSYDQHVFCFRMHKVRQLGLAAEACRTGPEMLQLLSWHGPNGAWQDTPLADDGFQALCATFAEPTCNYFTAPPTTAIDRERLLTLSAGRLRPTANWHQVRSLSSLAAESDERSKRLTFTHETAPESVEYRRRHLAALIKLQLSILTSGANFPPPIYDLRGNAKMLVPDAGSNFRLNMGPRTGDAAGATGVFLGLVPPTDATKLRDDLVREWGVEHTRRLVVWYETADAIENAHLPEPDFTSGCEPPASIVSDQS